MKRTSWLQAAIALTFISAFVFNGCKPGTRGVAAEVQAAPVTKHDTDTARPVAAPATAVLDTALYDAKLKYMANGDTSGRWPVKTDYPLPGAILPFKRVLAFYGNLYSTRMGILGELPEKEMLAKLQVEVKNWHAADTSMEVIPALHYIAVTAQGSAGADGKYRLRMPHKEIDKILVMAQKINALVFIDIQVGLSTLQAEVPQLEKYLKMPHVHLGIDPEFSMKTGKKPGSVIGSFDAVDINYTTEYLAKLVKENNLPPKMLVVHRFTRPMVTNYKNIKLRPETQIIMDMDGWGAQARKISTYRSFLYPEPVQYTGFKLFYKNDFREKGSRIMTPAEVLKLKPQPVYIQYQ
ncbi:hypothetical protein [Pseudoflavitalea rhizosphaerae]|uniref:hypothetical protein n=1 Tax=Pseudoflavitalea rhizosphaerae TaxID=1884793 RepID=UPI000F8C754E|nr:hypothetical protein [Pseudoflavitalea rhizosphaerae]